MTPWEANLRALERHHPSVAQVIKDLAEGPSRGQWTPSRAGPPAVRVGGLALCSSFDPETEAGRAVPPWGPEVDFALLPGLGPGYLAEAVVRRHPDLPVIVAEPDPVWFAEVLAQRDLSSLWSHPFVIPLVGPDPEEVGRYLGDLACTVVETLAWRPLAELQPDWGRALAEQVAGAQARSRVNLATYRRFAGLWRRNLAKNQASANQVRSLSALKDRWKGVPAVVAAAGPSLAEAFEWIETRRSQIVLVAVDTAWASLAVRGIEPDVLVILDAQYWNGRHVDRPLPAQTLVVTEWTAPPRAFRLAPGRTFVAASSLPFLRPREAALWGDLGALPSGGSVATAAWSLALHLGCREVAFAGLDLGFPGGQTHVPGSQFEEAVHRRSARFTPAETLGLGLRTWEGLTLRPALDGGLVASDPRMDLFRDWLTAAVRARPEVRAVNLGRRGSVIAGLQAPEVDYGSLWPLRPTDLPALGSPLNRAPTPTSTGPWSVLESFLQSPQDPGALKAAWTSARAFWGAEVWDRWAGRARLTWDRFPSSRSLRALTEAVAAAVSWRDFEGLS